MSKDSSELRTPAVERREIGQLRRLEVLTDVVYGVALWRVFMLLPRPDEPQWSWHSWRGFFASEGHTVVVIGIGVAVLIIYWLQSNTLLSLVRRADGKFAVRAILQVFFVLLFMFAVRVGAELPSSPGTRGLESFSALLLGLSAHWMWTYAFKERRLLHDDVTDAEARAVHRKIGAEPATAAFTIPFIYVPLLWDLSWFAYPLLRKIFVRSARKLLSQ